MTDAELTRMFVDHATRAGDFFHDVVLCRAALANYARKRGHVFVYLGAL